MSQWRRSEGNVTHTREECWTLLGHRRGGVWLMRAARHVVGQPVEVAFDAAWALAREERRGDVVGFLHTHPTDSLSPSRRDVRTMRAWCSAFGKPLVCLIAHGGRVAGYRFEQEADGGGDGYVSLAAVERFPRGQWIGVDDHGGQVPSRRAVSPGKRGSGRVAVGGGRRGRAGAAR